jgi:hypothetical protein
MEVAIPGFQTSLAEDHLNKERRKDSGKDAPVESLSWSMDDLRSRMTETKAKASGRRKVLAKNLEKKKKIKESFERMHGSFKPYPHYQRFDAMGDEGNVYNEKHLKSACSWNQIPLDTDNTSMPWSATNSTLARRKRQNEIPKNLFKRCNLIKSHWEFNPGDGPIGDEWKPIDDPLPKVFPKVPFDTCYGMSKEGRYKLRTRCKTNVVRCTNILDNCSTKTSKLASLQMEAQKSLADLKREFSDIDTFLKSPPRAQTAPASFHAPSSLASSRPWSGNSTSKMEGHSTFFVDSKQDVPGSAAKGSRFR